MNPDLLEILVCPACKAPLKENGNFLNCTNTACRRQYPVRNDIPIMLVDESDILSESDFQRLMQS
jgi:uncharacterized protein YbaR (Trm112 family)